MISKDQIIEHIQQINQSARREWLSLFDTAALQRYLDHLMVTLEPRGRGSSWIRPGETSAAITRRPKR